MSALFDDAERFNPHIVVGDTIRHAPETTNENVGPGTYSPSMPNSKDFGSVGPSCSRRSAMVPPSSPRSTERQRYATGSVVRDGIFFHTTTKPAGPGPGAYSPCQISSSWARGKTAKPSTGPTGRQAWDLRGSAGGRPLLTLRGGITVSSTMGSSPRMGDFMQVALHNGVLFLRGGAADGHRTSGIGPGTYHGVTNQQDSMTKRSYNLRAQTSQARRERSLSFSGTSSCAKAFLSNTLSDLTTTVAGRPDLHLLRSSGGRGAGDRGCTSPRPTTPSSSPSRPRCASPASTLVASMHHRGRHASAATAAADGATAGAGAAIGRLSGGGARSVSPRGGRFVYPPRSAADTYPSGPQSNPRSPREFGSGGRLRSTSPSRPEGGAPEASGRGYLRGRHDRRSAAAASLGAATRQPTRVASLSPPARGPTETPQGAYSRYSKDDSWCHVASRGHRVPLSELDAPSPCCYSSCGRAWTMRERTQALRAASTDVLGPGALSTENLSVAASVAAVDASATSVRRENEMDAAGLGLCAIAGPPRPPPPPEERCFGTFSSPGGTQKQEDDK